MDYSIDECDTMTISAIGLACLEIIGMQMGGAGNVARVQEVDREYRVTMAVATEMQYNMNSCARR